MKLALLFLIPCVAIGRINESLVDFKARVKAAPLAEYINKAGVTCSLFSVAGMKVEILSHEGSIVSESYGGIDANTARVIVAKMPGKFVVVPNIDRLEWIDDIGKLRAIFQLDKASGKYYLTISRTEKK